MALGNGIRAPPSGPSEEGISFRANSRTGYTVKSVLLFLSYKNCPISRRGYQFEENFFERGANLESRAGHTHPKNSKFPPGGLEYSLRRQWADNMFGLIRFRYFEVVSIYFTHTGPIVIPRTLLNQGSGGMFAESLVSCK